MFAKEFIVLDADSHWWTPMRPLLEAALQLAQSDASWYGWNKQQIHTFLHQLPPHCSLLIGVWNTQEEHDEARDVLVLGCICEVVTGEVRTIHTFEALYAAHSSEAIDLPPLEQLEPGYEHGLALMRATRKQVAPVAWALFTDKTTWDEWLCSVPDDGKIVDKGEQLAKLARQGRCVLMGSQTSAYHHV